jgi:hypothetical protein
VSGGAEPERRPAVAEPLLGRLAADRPWLFALPVGDDALAPSLPAGSVAVVDATERRLIDGEPYALRRGDRVELWLWCEGFAALGRRLAGRPVGTLASLAEPPRWHGPVEPEELVVIGRVVGALGPAAAVEDPVVRLEQERTALAERLALARLELAELELEWHDRPLPLAGLEGLPPGKLRARLEERRADPALALRLDLERRIEALEARIDRLETLIAETPAVSLEAVRTKLQLVWSLHHAPLPAVEGDLERAAIGSALRALDTLLASDGGARPATPEGPPPRSSVLRLVPSPRRRR